MQRLVVKAAERRHHLGPVEAAGLLDGPGERLERDEPERGPSGVEPLETDLLPQREVRVLVALREVGLVRRPRDAFGDGSPRHRVVLFGDRAVRDVQLFRSKPELEGLLGERGPGARPRRYVHQVRVQRFQLPDDRGEIAGAGRHRFRGDDGQAREVRAVDAAPAHVHRVRRILLDDRDRLETRHRPGVHQGLHHRVVVFRPLRRRPVGADQPLESAREDRRAVRLRGDHRDAVSLGDRRRLDRDGARGRPGEEVDLVGGGEPLVQLDRPIGARPIVVHDHLDGQLGVGLLDENAATVVHQLRPLFHERPRPRAPLHGEGACDGHRPADLDLARLRADARARGWQQQEDRADHDGHADTESSRSAPHVRPSLE